MNKTAIKNFAVWARRKLISEITYKAGLYGISANGVTQAVEPARGVQVISLGKAGQTEISGNEIAQRNAFIAAINAKAREIDFAAAFRYVVEDVAYTWFNRLIAIRFMEVNDYLPSGVRVLSSENAAKAEPDFVTTPFDTDLGFTQQERACVLRMKDDNKLDELFRMLFIMQCNKLHDILPELFEKTADYTELLLTISFTDQDGVVWHLVHDISEDDFNVSKQGQVEIIGWLYQYYNTEPKDEVFALLKKNVKITKERIPAATQLFTPDWIVRYMIENSLGRLWVEGHPKASLQSGWKYYLEEAEQEPSVQEQLEQIRAAYKTMQPEDIRVIDPCMGSGHILVYAFDVLMQIYEAQGYTQRDAARLIIEKNLYGLDIDRRAYQLAYFAIMMKARQYNRRILNDGIQPKLYAIRDSRAITNEIIEFIAGGDNKLRTAMQSIKDDLLDATEYGSILEVTPVDFDALMSRFDAIQDADYGDLVAQLNQSICTKTILPIVKQAQCMAQKYHVVCTNPPYIGLRNMSPYLFDYVMMHYKDTKQDLFGVFMNVCMSHYCKDEGMIAMITQHVWMFTSGFENLRKEIYSSKTILSLVHLGTRAFEEISGEVVQTCAFVIAKTHIAKYDGQYSRLVGYSSASEKETHYLNKDNSYANSCENYSCIPGNPICYWLSSKITDIFKDNPLVGDVSITRQGLKTSDDKRFVRLFFEVDNSKIAKNIQSLDEAVNSSKKWFWLNKGGQVKWYGNNIYLINWENDGQEIKEYAVQVAGSYSKNITAIDAYFKPCISWPQISISHPSFRYIPNGYIFASAGPSLFINDESQKWYMLGLLNSCVTQSILDAINPTINFGVSDILKVPFIDAPSYREKINELVQHAINLTTSNWDSFESSWDFKKHPFIKPVNRIVIASDNWIQLCEQQYTELRDIEKKINMLFCEIYGLSDELDTAVEERSVNIVCADVRNDVKSFISYAVGCMFGRYSLDMEGLAYAGGEWDASKYKSFLPDADNCIPITDEEYFEDDIVGRFVMFIRTVYGDDTLEENLDFIASALENKGNTSREIIRNYFLNDFFKNHCKVYQKRPIYWLFDSGKQNGFKALVYMHRWDADTTGNVRAEYLFRMQKTYEREIARMQEIMDNSTNAREIATAEKRKEKLVKQLKETRDYDAKIAHLALSRIDIDLDDGVKVNYEKVQTGQDGKKLDVLAKF